MESNLLSTCCDQTMINCNKLFHVFVDHPINSNRYQIKRFIFKVLSHSICEMASMKNNRELDSQIKNHIMIIRITWLLKELDHNVPDQELILIEIGI